MPDKGPTYEVKTGDTLWGISQHYGTDVGTLATLNHLHGRQRHVLRVGQIIQLPGTASQFDTELQLKILDLAFRPIKRPKLKLEFDGSSKEFIGDDQGHVGPVHVHDHATGLKVYFLGIDGAYALIGDHETLPLGRKRLTLTSRKMVVHGKYWFEKGTNVQTSPDLQRAVKQAHPDPHLKPEAAKGKATATPPPAPPKAASPSPAPVATRPASVTSSAASGPKAVPSPVIKETRVEGGKPQQAVGAVFAEENLHLAPPNEKYRALLISTAKRHGLTPHALAALINAEASKLDNGEWNADAKAGSSSAAGLTQFLNQTWLQVATDKRSAVNQKLKAEHGFEQVNGQWVDKTYSIYGKTGKVKTPIASAPVLALRFKPEYSIDAAAVYGLINLDHLKADGLGVDALAPEDLAKLIYLAHHEGAGGAFKVLKGTLSEDKAKDLLPTQIGDAKATELAKRFGGKYAQAYPHWLYGYIDSKINVVTYMVKPGTTAPRLMADIAVVLNGAKPAKPAPKAPAAAAPKSSAAQPAANSPSASATSSSGVGGAGALQNPMKSCILRTAGLASAKGATFGKVRSNGTKNHQGIDLEADVGTSVYAVANGKVISVSKAFSATENFGATVLLEVDVNDLPPTQRTHFKATHPDGKSVYFFYAHLSRIDVELGKSGALFVKAGALLGATGDSGNAHGMTTIAKGGHLHFEVRYRTDNIGKGLGGRMDPLPFLVSYVMPNK